MAKGDSLGQQPTELEFCDQTDRLGSDWALQRPLALNTAF